MTWPRLLSHYLEFRAEPVCPTCPFGEYCNEALQRGVNESLVKGRIVRIQDCFMYKGLADLTREQFGVDPPATPEAFLELVAERVGMQEEEQ